MDKGGKKVMCVSLWKRRALFPRGRFHSDLIPIIMITASMHKAVSIDQYNQKVNLLDAVLIIDRLSSYTVADVLLELGACWDKELILHIRPAGGEGFVCVLIEEFEGKSQAYGLFQGILQENRRRHLLMEHMKYNNAEYIILYYIHEVG